MSSFLKKLVALACVVVALVCTSPAQAALTLELSVDGGAHWLTPVSTTTLGNSVTETFSSNGAILVVTGSFTQGVNSAVLSQVQTQIDALLSAVSLNLVVAVSNTSYTAPTGGATLTSSFSGTGTLTDTGSGTFLSVIDYNNNLFGGLPIGGTPSGNTFSTGSQPVTLASDYDGTTSARTTATTPFALSNEYDVGNLRLGAGTSAEFTGTSSLSAATPAPPTVVVLLTALPLLGFIGWLRRRKQLRLA